MSRPMVGELIRVGTNLLDYWINPDGKLDELITSQALNSIDDIVESKRAMSLVTNDEIAINAIMGSEIAMNAVASSDVAINEILTNEIVMDSILANERNTRLLMPNVFFRTEALSRQNVNSAIWASSTLSLNLWEQGSPTPPHEYYPGYRESMFIPSPSGGNALRFRSDENKYERYDESAWSIDLDLTKIETIRFKAKASPSNSGGFLIKVRIDENELLSIDNYKDSAWVERSLNVSQFTGISTLSFGVRYNYASATDVFTRDFADIQLIKE